MNAGLTVNETFATAYGGVRIPTASADWSVYATLGARYFNLNGSLDLSVPVWRFFPFRIAGRTWADPVVGVKARHRIDDKWSIEFEADAGGYQQERDGAGLWGGRYKWNQSLTTSLGYRVLYIYYQAPANSGNGSFRFQEFLYGPQFNTTFTF